MILKPTIFYSRNRRGPRRWVANLVEASVGEQSQVGVLAVCVYIVQGEALTLSWVSLGFLTWPTPVKKRKKKKKHIHSGLH